MMVLSLTLLLWPGVGIGQTQRVARQTPQAAESSSPGIMDKTGRAIKDSWITSKTKAKLIAERRITRAVSVETRAGIVTLRGKVASAEEKQAAEQIAHGTAGVKAVRNALQVVPDAQRSVVDARDKEIRKGVKARLDNEAALKDADVAVRSDNGVVTLTGSVSDARVSARAAQLARAVTGVRAVRNELRAAAPTAGR
jgi:hyperosmotically inducible protein